MRTAAAHLCSAPASGLAPDLELAATLYLPDPSDGLPTPGLVVGHGAGSRRARHDAFCRAACSQGLAVLALDLRGHPAVDGRHLCYRGSSMGGFYGLKAASEAGFAALAARVRCPVLLVHARADSVVPFGHSLTLARRLGGNATLLALAGGTHTSAQHDPAIHRLTARWLIDQLKSACTERT